MKKMMMMLLLLVFVVAACSNTTNNNDDVNNNQAINNNENETDNNVSNNNDADDNNTENNAENNETTDDAGENNNTESDENAADDQSVKDQLMELSSDIFAAQNDEDYDFLESVLAGEAELNKDGNTFHFNDGEYEHDMEFVQADPDDLEYRFIHENGDNVFVGYGVVDYETESSYAIEFEFVKEDGEWKMMNMDKDA